MKEGVSFFVLELNLIELEIEGMVGGGVIIESSRDRDIRIEESL